jgi:enoyl-CoA hydratase
MLSGRHFSGDEAMSFGMLNRLVPEGEHVEAALDLARPIAKNTEFGLHTTKRGLASGVDAPSLRQAIEMENRPRSSPPSPKTWKRRWPPSSRSGRPCGTRCGRGLR